jgi:hypothetical protein
MTFRSLIMIGAANLLLTAVAAAGPANDAGRSYIVTDGSAARAQLPFSDAVKLQHSLCVRDAGHGSGNDC